MTEILSSTRKGVWSGDVEEFGKSKDTGGEYDTLIISVTTPKRL